MNFENSLRCPISHSLLGRGRKNPEKKKKKLPPRWRLRLSPFHFFSYPPSSPPSPPPPPFLLNPSSSSRRQLPNACPTSTNNAGSWNKIPSRCQSYVKDYMTGPRYLFYSEIVANFSLAYASTVEIAPDGKDAWIFDVDETLLTNLPYYKAHGFGSEIFDENAWDAWVDLAEAPAIPASLKLYNELKHMGFKIFVLTGWGENQRNATGKNLLLAGYSGWERLLLPGPSDQGTAATLYKSWKRSVLVNGGYRIHGSSGDQWSDLLGFALAKRSFKLPNPMYYVG